MKLPPSPFKGLAYFGDSEHDWHFFFGRERESEVVAANLMASRLTVLYGPSGVGKSSLLRAGVAGRLRTLVPAVGGEDEGAEVVIVDSWRDDPILAVAVPPAAPTDIPLADALAERAISTGAELYLILDQMEEYVLYHGRDGGPLAGALEDVLTRPDLPVHVLLGVRDDSLADLDALKRRLPGLFGNVLRLDHLTRAAARSAIEGPLRAYAELGGPEVDGRGRARRGRARRGRGRPDRAAAVRPRARRRGQARAPCRGAVPPARARAALGGRARARLRRAARVDAGRARRCRADRRGASRARARRARRRRARSRRASLQPPRDSVGDEDRARRRRPRALRGRGSEPARAGARRARRGAHPPPRPGEGGGPPRYEIFHDVLAPAVLAWRTRHEAERALERERAAARRRHRRVAVVAAVALVALAGTTALAVWALSQRADARKQALAADAGALAAKARELEANAIVELGRDPELGLLLATHAARSGAGGRRPRACSGGLYANRASARWRDLGSPVSDLAALPGGVLAAVTERGGVRLVRGGTPGRVVLEPRRGAQTWLSGGRRSRCAVATLTVRRLPRGNVVATIPVPRDTRFAASGPQSGRFVIAGKRGASVIDAEGQVLAVLPHPARVHRAAFSPNGLLIATAGADGDAIVWRGFGERLRTLSDQGESTDTNIFDVSFSHLSRLLVTASSDGTARVWNVRSGAPSRSCRCTAAMSGAPASATTRTRC